MMMKKKEEVKERGWWKVDEIEFGHIGSEKNEENEKKKRNGQK